MSVIRKKKTSHCESCPLYKQPVVWGSGNQNSSIVLINEYPRERDCRTGEPFATDRQRLEGLLKNAGLPRRIYKTHAVRCLIPDGINKQGAVVRDAVKHCRKFLKEELSLIGPEIVVSFGDVGVRGILDKSRITQLRGMWYDVDDYKVLPTLSLRTHHGSHKNITLIERDLKVVADKLFGRETEKVKKDYFVADTMPKVKLLYSLLKKAKLISFDTETTAYDRIEEKVIAHKGAFNFIHTEFLCWSFSWDTGKAAVLPLEGFKRKKIWRDVHLQAIYKNFNKLFESKNKTWIIHNAMYDVRLLSKICHTKVEKMRIVDSMLLQHLVNENSALDLDSLSSLYTDLGSYKNEINDKYRGAEEC